MVDCCFGFASRRRHTRCALVTGVQTCALPIFRGEVKVKTFTGDPEAVGDYGPLRDAQGQRSFKLKVHRLAKGDVVVASIKGVGDRNAAEALKGTELYVEIGSASCRERVCKSV